MTRTRTVLTALAVAAGVLTTPSLAAAHPGHGSTQNRTADDSYSYVASTASCGTCTYNAGPGHDSHVHSRDVYRINVAAGWRLQYRWSPSGSTYTTQCGADLSVRDNYTAFVYNYYRASSC